MRETLNLILDNATGLVLTSDGWSNLRGEHLVNFVIKVPGHKPIFYKCIDTSGVQQTAEATADNIEAILTEVGVMKFCAVITDNAAVMRKAWELIKRKYPHISCNGCAAHVLNLFVKDTYGNSFS